MSDQALAEAVAALIDVLDDCSKFDRCSECERLAVGQPDIGPSVLAPVCEHHVPLGTHYLLGGEEDVRDALRDVFAKLAPYGIHFDPETGRRTSSRPDYDIETSTHCKGGCGPTFWDATEKETFCEKCRLPVEERTVRKGAPS